MSYRIGVDIGGTFTDFALLDDATGVMRTDKQLTTPADPSAAVLEGIADILEASGVPIGEVSSVVHGTTLVTNAIIEAKGVPTAMLVTAGFRDILDIALERRYDLFDLRIVYPRPVVPRPLRLEVRERINHAGEVTEPLDLDSITAPFRALVERHRIRAAAVCCLHSYANPTHERAIRDRIEPEFPGLHVSISSEVFPFMREYERWTTTCLNAYVQPIVDRYLGRLEDGLVALGFRGRLHVMSSSGGTLGTAVARRFPVRLLESGPAAGALMSARHGRVLGVAELLSFDMGGTTAKGCIIKGSQPLKRYDHEVARVHEFKRGSGLPARIPVIDMIEIGAGGGSIAMVDERGVLRVGPRSAGADPGPACYGRGGQAPTLTDANLVLGYLDAASFLGGRMPIDPEAARRAITEAIAGPLGVDPLRAAWGIHEVINEDVARAFRVHASERGVDYRRASMVAFGGSGPIHALRIARKLRIPRVICPPGAGVMSAFGLLVSPVSFELLRSRRIALADLSPAALAAEFLPLEREATRFVREGTAGADGVQVRRRLDMRYVGQGYEVEVALPDGVEPAAAGAELPTLFARRYEEIFSVSFHDKPVEIVNWKVEVVATQAADREYHLAGGGPEARAARRHRPAYAPDVEALVECPVYERAALGPGARIEGPALIEEAESTCVLGPRDVAVIDTRGNLVSEIGA